MSTGRRVFVLAAAVLLASAPAGACSSDADDRDGPDRSVPTQDDALAAAVRVEAFGCNDTASVGAGSFVASERVVTVAHVVAGAQRVEVVLANRKRVTAKVTGIDRTTDLALLDVEEPVAPLATGRMPTRATGEFVVYRDDVAVTQPFRVLKYGDIQVAGSSDDGPAHRHGYELDAEVTEGDSGSVLVTGGVATAVVFARSADHSGRAWAVDISEAGPLLDADDDEAVDTGGCWR